MSSLIKHTHTHTNIFKHTHPSHHHQSPPPLSRQLYQKDLNSVNRICLPLPWEQQSTVITRQIQTHTHTHTLSLFLLSLHTHSLIHACTHTHMHLAYGEDQRLIMPYHQLHHPLLGLSSSCLMCVCVFVCVRLWVHVDKQTTSVCGCGSISVLTSGLFESFFFFPPSHAVNKWSCPPLPLFSSIFLHLLDVFSSPTKQNFSVYISWFNGNQVFLL